MGRPDSSFVNKVDGMISETENEEALFEVNHEHIRNFFSEYDISEESKENALQAAKLWEVMAFDAELEKYGDETDEVEEWWEKTFICRRAAAFESDGIDLENLFFFAVSGILSEKLPQVRVILEKSEIPEISSERWDQRLQEGIMRATLLLVRKSGGWNDIREANAIIEKLRDEQERYEEHYLDSDDRLAVRRTVALYNLSRVIELTIDYVSEGTPSDVIEKIKRFNNNASTALENQQEADVNLLNDGLFLICKKMVTDSLWYQARGLMTSEGMENYVQRLITGGSEPILDLLPSQQEAFSEGSLDIYQRSIMINMPTSAGKTLLAEFNIVQSKNMNEDSTVVYLAPTRALVNQTSLDLRKKLGPLDLTVESAVPIFDIDPNEEEFLREDIDVLVSTPEKLELLVKEEHPVVSDISLVVADEVHNIEEDERGANLELLLSTLNRECENIRFLLLSPFVPNGEEIATWLGREQSKNISVSWKASDQVTAVSRVKRKSGREYIDMTVVPSHANTYVKDEFTIEIEGPMTEGGTYSKKKASGSTALNLASDDGAVLVLCMGKSYALERAQEISSKLDPVEVDEEFRLILDFIREELGESHFLLDMLKKGVAVHHAGIPDEIQYLIERLTEQGQIRVLTSTTTLAQGVNFPIKHVILEGTTIPQRPPKSNHELTHNEFWNIAGRAGRAFQDHMGGIIFSAGTKEHVEEYKEYLKKDADKLLSAIREALVDLEETDHEFNLQFVRKHGEFASFIKYILHTVNVSSYDDVQSDIEDVLRSSLVYYQLEEEDPQLARELLSLTNSYLDEIGVAKDNEGYIDLIDRTGFTSISVNNLFRAREELNLTKKDTWEPQKLFSKNNEQLTVLLDVLDNVPEVKMGRYTQGELETDEISDIIKEWVEGATIEEIANNHFDIKENEVQRIVEASEYVNTTLMGSVSWGISSLQKVSAFGNEEVEMDDINHVPAMVYYGVDTEEAATLRMVGVPRSVAQDMGDYYSRNYEGDESFQDLRSWLLDLDEEVWAEASSFDSIEGRRAKKLWKILNGLE